MGTRGLMAFSYDGEVKGMYNHYDSYPGGLGEEMVTFIKSLGGDFSEAKDLFKRLQAVDEDETPTEDQKLALLRYYDSGVSTGSSDEWYALLRNTQGNPHEALNAGFYIDGLEFAKDSLFCEWGYVVDFDREVLEVYKGFQTEPHTEGRWASPEPSYTAEWSATSYYPIRLFKEIPFSELEEKATMEAVEEEAYPEDEE